MFMYTAYLNESGTHDGSPVIVMGGVLARAEQWRFFEKKFAPVQSAREVVVAGIADRAAEKDMLDYFRGTPG